MSGAAALKAMGVVIEDSSDSIAHDVAAIVGSTSFPHCCASSAT